MAGRGRMDGVLLTCMLLLCLWGLIMVYSSSAILAQTENKPETAYLRSQMVKLVVGLGFLAFFARRPAGSYYGRTSWWILGGAASLLVLLFLPVGLTTMVRGTRRFLNFRIIQVQPAEVARVAM